MKKIRKNVLSAGAAGIPIAGSQNVKAAELTTGEILPKELQTDQAEPFLENTEETAPGFTQLPEETMPAPDSRGDNAQDLCSGSFLRPEFRKSALSD